LRMLSLVFAACLLAAATASESLINTNVDRVIDLTNQLTTITVVQFVCVLCCVCVCVCV
jgi:uncharacterized membrane protein YgcG